MIVCFLNIKPKFNSTLEHHLQEYSKTGGFESPDELGSEGSWSMAGRVSKKGWRLLDSAEVHKIRWWQSEGIFNCFKGV